MSRKMLLIAVGVSVSTVAFGQVLQPGGPKAVVTPVMPVMTVPTRPVSTAPVATPVGSRTIEMLKNAGIVNPTVEQPIALSPRKPFIDEMTYLGAVGSDYSPGAGVITLTPNSSVSWAVVAWNPTSDRRYVLDCAFQASDNAMVTFRWQQRSTDQARVVGGHAGVILPAGVQPPVQVSANAQAFLTGCDVTPFGS